MTCSFAPVHDLHGTLICSRSFAEWQWHVLGGNKNRDTVGSQLSKLRLSVSELLDVTGCCHVFGSSVKNTLQSLEFCYRRKQSCCMNDFSWTLLHLFQQVRDLRSQFTMSELAERSHERCSTLYCSVAIKRWGK